MSEWGMLLSMQFIEDLKLGWTVEEGMKWLHSAAISINIWLFMDWNAAYMYNYNKEIEKGLYSHLHALRLDLITTWIPTSFPIFTSASALTTDNAVICKLSTCHP